MEMIRRYRAMGQLCRQQAVFHPEKSWHWLGEALRWENLAEREVTSHYLECNSRIAVDNWSAAEAA
jgi:hypothetical protein